MPEKSCINTERVPPGCQFNMATISVKRSIHNITISDQDARRLLQLSLYYSHFEITEFSHLQYLFDLEAGLMKSNNKKAATYITLCTQNRNDTIKSMNEVLYTDNGLEPIRLQGLPVILKWM